MTKVCNKHEEKPAMIYGQCIGCEIENYQRRIKELEEENKRLNEVIADRTNDIKFYDGELERVKAQHEQEKVQSNHDFYAHQTTRSLLKHVEEELSAKDKVLEWYASDETFEWQVDDDPLEMPHCEILDDSGERARSILSQYPKE